MAWSTIGNIKGPGKIYTADIGDGTSNVITVTHNLGTRDIQVSLREKASPWATVVCNVKTPTVDTCTLGFHVAPSSSQYRVTIIGAL